MAVPKILQKLIDQFSRLPGIGPKSAARIAFHILSIPDSQAESFSQAINDVKKKVVFCEKCHNIGSSNICDVCNDSRRDNTQIMIVEDVLDLLAFEGIGEYKGLYHVLGGAISPMNGIGPEELNFVTLFKRIPDIEELIVATNPNLEGEATAMYLREEINKRFLEKKISITRIARGVPSGADLDYTDKMTLSRALGGRTVL